MGNIFSNCPCRRHRIGSVNSSDITLLMIGLDNAGKTCTAKHLLGENTSSAVPTVGFTSLQIKHGKYSVCIYDIGGGSKIRGIWKNYYALVHGVIFVVDATETERFQECKNEITNVIRDERIAGKPVLLLFNKQDLDSAVNETELVNLLELESLVNAYQCPTRVEGSCAIYEEKNPKDPGIQAGFNWLIGHIAKEFKILAVRVEREKAEQMKKEEQNKAERMERVRKLRMEREKAEQLRKEQEALSNPKPNGCCDDEDDDDVIVGNPFKPVNVIKAELDRKEEIKSNSTQTCLPGISVIHVSPTNSSGDKEEIILQPQMPMPCPPNANHSKALEKPTFERFSISDQDDSKQGSRFRKPKKRFKNRIVPHTSDKLSLIQSSTSSHLPPLKSSTEILNGNIAIYSPPKRQHTPANGQITWETSKQRSESTKSTAVHQ